MNTFDKELQLSKLEKEQLIQYYKEKALPSFKVDNETPQYESDNFWDGIQFDKRMFDLCVYWSDYKIVCVVYECDPTEDDNWTTNMTACWYLSDEVKMTKVTKEDIIWASGHYLGEHLPSDYDEWEEEKIDEFLEANAWEYFEYADPKFIWEQIESLAWSMRHYVGGKDD